MFILYSFHSIISCTLAVVLLCYLILAFFFGYNRNNSKLPAICLFIEFLEKILM